MSLSGRNFLFDILNVAALYGCFYFPLNYTMKYSNYPIAIRLLLRFGNAVKFSHC